MPTRAERYRAAEAGYWRAVGTEPTETWAALQRTGLSVRIQVTGSGTPVLFLHGGSTSGTGWAPLAARLADHRCLLVDRPGCGLSEPARLPMRSMDLFEPFADDLVAQVLDGLGIDQAHLVATSFGAYFALRGAVAHPDRVDRMLLLGFPIGADVQHTPLSMRLTAVPGLGSLMTRMPVGERMARSMLRQLGLGPALDEGRLPQEGVAWFRSLLNDTDTMRNEISAMPPVMHPRHGLSPALVLGEDLLASVTSPTFLLWGAKDPIGGAEVARAFAAKIPGAHLEILPEAGHVPWLDEPDDVASTATRFFGGVGGS
jgi:pimeloyl-ACP methyl ester carboxylesterase